MLFCYVDNEPEFSARPQHRSQRRQFLRLPATSPEGTECQITLTDIADAIGMHKSALLRYFETREQIFLVLAAEGWHECSSGLRKEMAQLDELSPATIAAIFAKTLTARPIFCDLLAQAH